MTDFLTEDFLLQTETARSLYHEHAAKMPIYDYHCHIPPQQIAEDKQFENLTQIWLYGDHQKSLIRPSGIAAAVLVTCSLRQSNALTHIKPGAQGTLP